MNHRKPPVHENRPDGSPYRWLGLACTKAAYDAHLKEQQKIRAQLRAARIAKQEAEYAARMAPLAVVADAYGDPLQLVHDHQENSLRIAQRLQENSSRRAVEVARMESEKLGELLAGKE